MNSIHLFLCAESSCRKRLASFKIDSSCHITFSTLNSTIWNWMKKKPLTTNLTLNALCKEIFTDHNIQANISITPYENRISLIIWYLIKNWVLKDQKRKRFKLNSTGFSFSHFHKSLRQTFHFITMCVCIFFIFALGFFTLCFFYFVQFVVNLQYVTNKCKQRWLHHNSPVITEEKTVFFVFHLPSTSATFVQKISFISFIQPLDVFLSPTIIPNTNTIYHPFFFSNFLLLPFRCIRMSARQNMQNFYMEKWTCLLYNPQTMKCVQ